MNRANSKFIEIFLVHNQKKGGAHMKKKFLVISFAIAVFIALTGAAKAEVLDFDDLTNATPVPE